ncbi:MAG: DUF58 domain-containing protein [Planctomycetes bacterium]|nr:DUF58 domain-containing protein [Planctomycetota bacterium]
MIQPTRRALLLLTALFPLALLPALFDGRGRGGWAAGIVAFALALAVDLLQSRRARGFSLTVELPPQLFVGDPDPIEVTVTTAAAGAPAGIALRLEASEEIEAPPTVQLRFDGEGSAHATLRLAPRRRGVATLREAWLRWSGPLGLIERSARHPLAREIAIVPDVRAVRAAAIALARRSPAAGRKIERFQGDGSEFQALRDFVPGLDPRTLDWKATARHRKLLCRELRAERNHPLVLAFDTGHRMREPIDGVSRLDRAINAALLLGYVALRAEDRVALFAFDSAARAFLPFVAGAAQFDRLRAAAAELEATTEESNYTLGLSELSRHLPRRSLVVLFTDFADAIGAELLVDNVGRLARRHVVLLVAVRDDELDRIAAAPPATERALHDAVTATELIRERARVLEQVRRLGVLVLDAPAAAVRAGLIDRYLEVQRRELVA